MENFVEQGPERMPTKAEVLDAIGRLVEKPTIIIRELSDEQGLYLLEAKVEVESLGETTQYEYIRKGRFPDGNQSLETVIHVVFYEDGVPCGGHDVANYNTEVGEWVF